MVKLFIPDWLRVYLPSPDHILGNILKKGKGIFFLVVFFLCFIRTPANATDYSTVYNAYYTVVGERHTHVKLSVDIDDMPANIYLREFTLSFPSSLSITNATAIANESVLKTELVDVQDKQQLTILFSQPEQADKQLPQFIIEFDQEGLFEKDGQNLQFMLPNSTADNRSKMSITLNVPSQFQGKLSIAKPKPSENSGKTIVWNDVTTDTVYAVFGASRSYRFKLDYNLQNDRKIPVRTEIALPPETSYQTVLLESIAPKASRTRIDEDGNYLVEYRLKPKEALKITAKGYVTLLSRPQVTMERFNKHAISAQREYLLKPHTYWNLDSKVDSKYQFSSPEAIYRFVTQTLDYDYTKVKPSTTRLGATQVLNKPQQAVCREFTDLFIALARENGIFAREINGFADGGGSQMRPVSLSSDILHAWPEYYQPESNKWIPVDPTWENTSGIDYFSSLDLNHIVFAIHGKDPEYPAAAGMYKVRDSRDVSVVADEKVLESVESVSVDKNYQFLSVGQKDRLVSLTVINTGNVFLKNKQIKLSGKGVLVNTPVIEIPLLAPMEKKTYSFTYRVPKSMVRSTSSIELKINGLYQDEIKLKPQTGYRFIQLTFFFGMIFTLSCFVILRLYDHKRKSR